MLRLAARVLVTRTTVPHPRGPKLLEVTLLSVRMVLTNVVFKKEEFIRKNAARN